ncbi:MAG: hypothetical protein IPN34_25870 [Planctomycetes bacterium]|nr:hypothetical protein [Planctomycetota bacterium]
MSRLRFVVRSACAATALLLAAPSLLAQTTIAQGTALTFGSSAHANLVQDGAGRLYALLLEDQPNGDRALALQVSFDGGVSWNRLPTILNDATSGLQGPNLTNNAACAIDDQGALHVTWAAHYYPSYYAQYYRSCDPLSGACSPIVDVTLLQGAANTARTAAMAIAVDAANTIWLVAQSTSSWVEHLLRSTQPYAAGGTFASVGSISPSASSQTSRIAIDAQGLVHCAYYRNVSPGIYEHRAYDPQSGWGVPTTLGNTTSPQDYYGLLSSDALGNVHAVLVKDAASPATWDFVYRRWDVGNGWSAETPLFQADPSRYTGIANFRIFALACNETTGRVSVLYRDLASDARLKVVSKALGALAFQHAADLRPGDLALNAYSEPVLRGTLFPAFNRAGATLDCAWREGGASSRLLFQRLPECNGSLARFGPACVDGAGASLALSFEGAPCLGGALAVGLRTSQLPSLLIVGLSSTNWNGIPLPFDLALLGGPQGCALLTSQETILGPVAAGTLSSFPVPTTPLLVGQTGYFQALVVDPRLGVALPIATSDGLAATFQR